MRERTGKSNFIRYQLPVLVWAVLIFVSSSLPSRAFPALNLPHLDKVVHLIFYLGLCVLTHRAMYYQSRFPTLAQHSILFTFLFCVAYGVSDEVHQIFVPGRAPDLADLATDIVGVLMGLGVVLYRRHLQSEE